jgi:hypothetical protein
MSVRRKAIGVAWGLAGSAFAYAAAATVLAVKGVSEEYKKSARKVEVLDSNGEPNGLVFFDQRKTVTLRLYPTAATIANADTAAGTMGIEVGDRLTITAAGDPDLAGATWVVDEVGKARTRDDIVFFDVTATKYAVDLSADTA